MDEMSLSFIVTAIDSDAPDVPGVEISATNGRYSGSAMAWVPCTRLNAFADALEGFPRKLGDRCAFEFGWRDGETTDDGLRYVRGFCALKMTALIGGVSMHAEFEDDSSDAEARFDLGVGAADIDRFVLSLRRVAESPTIGSTAILTRSS